MDTNEIPEMTDPLGRHWSQPSDIRTAQMDSTHVLLTTGQLAQLKDYSASYPSGTYDGKCWKREYGKGWLLCWYYPHARPGLISIATRRVLEVEQ